MLPHHDYANYGFLLIDEYNHVNVEKADISAYDIFNMRFHVAGYIHTEEDEHIVLHQSIIFSQEELTLLIDYIPYHYNEELDIFINEDQTLFVKLYAIIGDCYECYKNNTVLYTSYNCCDTCYWNNHYFEGSGIMR
jgi:hypothetical protein